ncbi:transposase [Bradyrhizobium rifense]|uniref:transposase n=1 Tax=Bradyrhizobium rifense TaxID=515499 RepID=UPI003D31CF01
MLRRDSHPADRGGAPAGPGPTGTTRAVRLRVSPQRHPNLFVTFDPYRGWRNVRVTDRRAAVDYAHCMRELVDVHYPGATCIRVVQDNLSIHKPGALYEAFAPAEARRILRRLEFHFTPKHASWLNMLECEISGLQRQCLGRRIDDPKRLRNQIAAWQRRRNQSELASNGCSQPTKPAPNSAAPIQSPPRSQHRCDEPLVA